MSQHSSRSAPLELFPILVKANTIFPSVKPELWSQSGFFFCYPPHPIQWQILLAQVWEHTQSPWLLPNCTTIIWSETSSRVRLHHSVLKTLQWLPISGNVQLPRPKRILNPQLLLLCWSHSLLFTPLLVPSRVPLASLLLFKPPGMLMFWAVCFFLCLEFFLLVYLVNSHPSRAPK